MMHHLAPIDHRLEYLRDANAAGLGATPLVRILQKCRNLRSWPGDWGDGIAHRDWGQLGFADHMVMRHGRPNELLTRGPPWRGSCRCCTIRRTARLPTRRW